MSAAMADPASEATSATLLKMSLFMMPPNYARAISCEDHSGRTQDLLSRLSNTKCRNLRDNIELEQFESSAPHRLGRSGRSRKRTKKRRQEASRPRAIPRFHCDQAT